ncbi:MAG: class I adenylate-forming enzyme family protein [Halobacteriales archaeon]
MTLELDRRADLWPDRTALIDHTDDREWTYGELEERIEATAGRLAAHDVVQGDAVAVLWRNHPEFLALLFAARRIGATLAPISHRLPAETVTALRDRIDPALTIVEDDFRELIEGSAPEHVTTVAAFADREPAPVDRVRSDTPPLYLHTGGTTGVPKVVVISDRQLEWNCITEAAAWGLGKDTVSPILLPMYHTGGWNLLTLPTLYGGGTVVLQRAFDPDGVLELIETRGATQVFGVAAMFQAMASADRFEATDFGTVEWFMSGGGPTPTDVIEAYTERGETFVQGYGLTEGGPNNLYVDPTRRDATEKPDSVGRPFPDCEIRIIDQSGDPIGSGDTGELEVRGPITADGYLVTDDGTFDGDWVSTGDLARRDSAGDVFIVGRTDYMFVSGGENVHPEVIERRIEQQPGVEAVGVIGVPHDRWGTVPKAIVVGNVDPAAVLEEARDRLADHEVPKEVTVVEELPMSGHGKLDRAALERRFGE